jgi:hypothetical protein
VSLPQYLRIRDAAKVLSMAEDQVRDLIHAGQLVGVDVSLARGGKARWRMPKLICRTF